ncbi:conserved hypothetical protein [Bathymodiolus platifrons methanotrophic gill symbiont]|uniref:GIY-YIG nuclease family protein n=1 Tax=Bathymodiolus platifrons methanotrophic gill symbiont TaxID=113268 RepID=UPI000B40A572|nr:GIY-YIG nuclease family protein [Bathymodiolus platifrons methanotrophic gill symbiont]TXK94531.1 hypothetical protein BMR10_12925 [Methylococcaceae bacterium CS4]TXK95311.1 hypothetical protein BMR11_13895 [Methylococcaceae bacterium CS5]TXL05091.1 hypothetical protein BMR07_10625 [Methylococcaceae bacterium CS1]TXL05744.1 hypothetical protein BMR09_09470 [Methylococcaceae bacterium CS3]TXL08875.1 hypothetical protein BMR08_13705 [Methylococcaceae bacterium CS2]
MINFAKELESILESDPLGLLHVKPKVSSIISADERLLISFNEINAFVNEQGREPTASGDINERKLFSRLKGLRNNPEKALALKDSDVFHLLGDVSVTEPEEVKTIDDVFFDDPLGLLADSDDIFTLRHVPKAIDMPENIAKRKPCKEFELYEHLFKQCHLDLVSGKSELRQFTGEQQISAGHFFVLHGVMVYVSEVGEKGKKRGKVNARLKCIFENGTESNMLLRSLATELYKDESGRRVLSAPEDYLNEPEQVTYEDKPTGYIYILRSLSEDPKIKEIGNLFKIGFSSQLVQERIKNAVQEPTYLMADVKVVAELQTFNLNPQKLELLLHTFFASACLNLDVFDAEGMRYTPREWFIVPLHIIETAIQLLMNGDIVNYRYDNHRSEIVEK